MTIRMTSLLFSLHDWFRIETARAIKLFTADALYALHNVQIKFSTQKAIFVLFVSYSLQVNLM